MKAVKDLVDDCWTVIIGTASEAFRVVRVGVGYEKETHAMAAAPDLLAAAEGALALIKSLKEKEGFKGAYAWEHDLSLAIAKARGPQ